jgi:hypothetical protein
MIAATDPLSLDVTLKRASRQLHIEFVFLALQPIVVVFPQPGSGF